MLNVSAPLGLTLVLVANVALAAAAYARGSLTTAGALSAAFVGAGIAATGGLLVWSLLALFFVSSSLWSRYRHEEKRGVETLTGKTDRRDAVQVLANGGPALLCAAIWRLSAEPAWLVAAVGALAEANADTWASEAGLLSRRTPVSLPGLRPVPRGQSGGVTGLGLAAALLGSALIALGLGAGSLAGDGSLGPASLGIVAAWGFLGSLLDSLLGGAVQARYRSAPSGAYTERPREATGEANRRVSGLPGVTNDVVNLASGLAAALGAALTATLLL
jgi:uncharacterized protein (TIGR00297 family)